MLLNYVKNVSVTIFCFSFIVSCGGGSSGDTTSAPPPIPPPPTASQYSLKFNQDNADAIGLGIIFSESILQSSQASINKLLEYTSKYGKRFQQCDPQKSPDGTLSISHNDLDGSYNISNGDSLNITYSNCYDWALDAVVNGEVEINVSDYKIATNGTVEVSGRIDFENLSLIEQETEPSITVSGHHNFQYSLGDIEKLEVKTETEDTYYVDFDGIKESSSSFLISKTFYYQDINTIDTDISIDIVIESQTYDGSFQCISTSFEFKSRTPSATNISCKGDKSSVRIVSNNVEVDEFGNNSFVLLGSILWENIIEGFFSKDSWTFLGIAKDNGFSQIFGKLFLKSKQAVQDKQNDSVLIVTEIDDPTFPNSILEYTQSDKNINLLNSFDKQINQLVLSSDSSQYCITFQGENEFSCFDQVSKNLTITLELNHGEYNSGNDSFPTIICDVIASPVEASAFAVTLGREGFSCGNVAIIKEGKQLSVTSLGLGYSTNGLNRASFAFSPSGNSVFTHLDKLFIDDNGISSIERYSGMDSYEVKVAGNLIYSKYDVVNPVSLVKLGKFSATYGGIGSSYFDIDDNTAYLMNSDGLNLFNLTTLTQFSNYDSNIFPHDFDSHTILSTSNELLIFGDEQVYFVDKSLFEIQQEFDKVCQVSLIEGSNSISYFDCEITNAIVDNERGLVYATVASKFGNNGNSIIVIDLDSKQIKESIFIGSEPRYLSLSGNNDILYVVLAESDQLVSLNLNTLTIDQEIPILPENSLDNISENISTAERRVLLNVHASPVAPDSIVLEIGKPSSAALFKIISLEHGQKMESEEIVYSSDVFSFDLDGSFYGANKYGDYKKFEQNSFGISLLESSIISDVGYYAKKLHIYNGKIYDEDGKVIDFKTGSVYEGYYMQKNISSNVTSSVLIEKDYSNIYYIDHQQDHSDIDFTIKKYDFETKEHTGSFSVEFNSNASFGRSTIGSSFISSSGDIGIVSAGQVLYLFNKNNVN